VPDTGEYEFRLTTPNGARLYVNVPDNGTQKDAIIDLWVSYGQVALGPGSRLPARWPQLPAQGRILQV